MGFLEKLLTFDPTKRISVKDSMQHPYIKDPDYPEDEPLQRHAHAGHAAELRRDHRGLPGKAIDVRPHFHADVLGKPH